MPVYLFAQQPGSGFLEVPQKSVSDYIFTIPVLTNDIRGKVIDPHSPYGVIRSEDVDWFKEAFMERESLILGNFVNRSHGVGAQIFRPDFGVFWNGPVRGDDNAWLDPDVQLIDGSRLIDINKVWAESVTNIFKETFMTNGVTNAFSVISMPMTNGTMSVFTNQWSARRLFDSGLTNVTTNVFTKSILDFCCEGVEVFSGYTNTPKMRFGSVIISNDVARLRYTDFFNAGVFSNACEVLRGTKRLADNNVNPTNAVMLVFEEVVDDPDGWYYSRDEGLSLGGRYYVYTLKDQAVRRYTPTYTAILPTRFGGHIATAGGFNRVSLEAVYATCTFKYLNVKDHVTVTSVDTNVLLKVTSATLDTSGATAFVKFGLDAHALCTMAAKCADVPDAPGLYDHREGGYDDGSVWELYTDNFVIFYAITPGTVLPGWQ